MELLWWQRCFVMICEHTWLTHLFLFPLVVLLVYVLGFVPVCLASVVIGIHYMMIQSQKESAQTQQAFQACYAELARSVQDNASVSGENEKEDAIRENVWLNKLLREIWQTTAESWTYSYIRNSLEPMLQANKPSFIQAIRIGIVELGKNSPVFAGLSIIDPPSPRDAIAGDGRRHIWIEGSFLLDAENFRLCLTMVRGKKKNEPFEISSVRIACRFRMRLTLARRHSQINRLQISMLAPPLIDFTLRGRYRVKFSSFPGFSSWFRSLVESRVQSLMVWPQAIDLVLNGQHAADAVDKQWAHQMPYIADIRILRVATDEAMLPKDWHLLKHSIGWELGTLHVPKEVSKKMSTGVRSASGNLPLKDLFQSAPLEPHVYVAYRRTARISRAITGISVCELSLADRNRKELPGGWEILRESLWHHSGNLNNEATMSRKGIYLCICRSVNYGPPITQLGIVRPPFPLPSVFLRIPYDLNPGGSESIHLFYQRALPAHVSALPITNITMVREGEQAPEGFELISSIYNGKYCANVNAGRRALPCYIAIQRHAEMTPILALALFSGESVVAGKRRKDGFMLVTRSAGGASANLGNPRTSLYLGYRKRLAPKERYEKVLKDIKVIIVDFADAQQFAIMERLGYQCLGDLNRGNGGKYVYVYYKTESHLGSLSSHSSAPLSSASVSLLPKHASNHLPPEHQVEQELTSERVMPSGKLSAETGISSTASMNQELPTVMHSASKLEDEFLEISEKTMSALSLHLARNLPRMKSEIAKSERKISMAMAKPTQRKHLEKHGVTESLCEFVIQICLNSDILVKFPLRREDLKGFELSTLQHTHATELLKLLSCFRFLRYLLIPRYFREVQFWCIYFSLVGNQLKRKGIADEDLSLDDFLDVEPAEMSSSHGSSESDSSTLMIEGNVPALSEMPSFSEKASDRIRSLRDKIKKKSSSLRTYT